MESKSLLIEKLPIKWIFSKFNDMMTYDWLISSNYYHALVNTSFKDAKLKKRNLTKTFFVFIIPSSLMSKKEKAGVGGWSYTIKNSLKTFKKEFNKVIGNHDKTNQFYLFKEHRRMNGIDMNSILIGIPTDKNNIEPNQLRELTKDVRELIIDNLSSKDPLRHKYINP